MNENSSGRLLDYSSAFSLRKLYRLNIVNLSTSAHCIITCFSATVTTTHANLIKFQALVRNNKCLQISNKGPICDYVKSAGMMQFVFQHKHWHVETCNGLTFFCKDCEKLVLYIVTLFILVIQLILDYLNK